MNEREVTALLERRASVVPTSDPPTDAILDAARRGPARHRHRKAFLAAAAALVLVVGAGVAWDAARNQSSPPLPTDTPLPVHEGYRWVGMNGIAFEVPASWTTSDSVCADPTVDTVVVDWRGRDACPAGILPSVSSLHLGTLDARNFIAEVAPPRARHTISIDGVAAIRTDLVDLACGGPISAQDCTSVFGASVLIPSKNVLAWVVSPRRSIVIDIFDSARTIPDGYLAVPDLSGMSASRAADALGALGLDPDPLCPDGGQVCGGDLIVRRLDPPPGTVVAFGSHVSMVLGPEIVVPAVS
jgi:hypothetical protein